jgi:gluconate 5-dehydrogenase
MIAYNTTKGGLVNFVRALAGEWGPYGITVNALAPGFFPSKMTRGLLAQMESELKAAAPLQRLGDDEDLKGAAVLFASDAGKHISGQVLAVDGGVTAV